ncbi:MAG: SprB repeat-containing protein, partial [Bacteroidota bacterium]
MKKNYYLLILDLLLNIKKISLSQSLMLLDNLFSGISTKRKGYIETTKTFIFSEKIFQKGLSVFSTIIRELRSLKRTLTMYMEIIIPFAEKLLMKLNFASFDFTNKKLRKNSTAVFVFLMLLFFNLGNSQIKKPFTPRLPGGNIKVKGDVILIGSTILGKTTAVPTFSTPPQDGVLFTGTVTNLATLTSQANTPFNDRNTANNIDNNTENLEYIDIDSDNTTFSSSSATLNINNSCKKIVFAGLYWAAIYPYERSTDAGQYFRGSTRIEDWNTLKFKVPGSATYQNLTADQVIFDGYNPTNRQNSFYLSPYVCFKDVTSQLAGLTNADGVYTVANMRAARGRRSGGAAGGWTLVVIYESPTLPSKFISIFDGYANLNPDVGVDQFLTTDINISGFNTLPGTLPVNAKIGISSLEGDIKRGGDFFYFKAGSLPPATPFTQITDAINTTGNFFNSSISANGAFMTGRTPNSNNTMGFDIDNVVIPNPGNTVIPNNETSATLRLTTTSSSGDGYAAFLTSFAVDIIEPVILLTKEVFDNASPPNNMANQDVTLGQQLNYVLGFQNQGNDAANSFTIKDVLPINVKFNYPADIDIASLPPGVTHSYNAVTRTIIFTIPNNLVEINDPRYTIRFKVKVVETCNELSDACSNIIKNSAYATYRGIINTAQITDDPSLSSFTTCNLGTPQSTNFLVDIDDCIFTKNEVLCGNNVVLTAANGYNSYKWSTLPFNNSGVTSGTILGNSQTLTVTNPGTYYVYNTAIAPCLSITEVVTVTRFGGVITNPVIPYADQVVTCPNDGKLLPNIFLCGGSASRLINTNISDGSTIVWEKLTESSTCNTVTNSNCANESSADSCWTSAGANGPSFTANTSGQYRLTLNYPGNCFNRFYFNVYQNLLNPTETHRDIVCTTAGNITINGVGSGYEYSINGTTYQASNSFTVNTAAIYTVYIRQIGVATNPCIFTIPNIPIRQRAFTATPVVTQPFCNGDKGSIKLTANDVLPQYYYSISQGSTLINSVGPIAAGDYTFSNLNPGVYSYTVSTQDGCTTTSNVTITQPAVLTATSALTIPLSCTDGEITVYPVGGTAPYYYFVNSPTVFQTDPKIVVTTPGGAYNIRVVDSNNCIATTSITVTPIPPPAFTVSKTDINCYNGGGSISFNVTNANGNTLAYSIDNGLNYFPTSTFSNLTGGTYNTIVRYTLGTAVCYTTMQPITIAQPSAALTASAGVSELAGCGPLGEGKVRITNPQGGTPFPAPNYYLYSFDNQATWVTTNEAYKLPGTYTLYIKDALGCIYQMPNIIIDPEPVDPTINISAPNINCDGTANSTATVTNPNNTLFTYNYYLDGVLNPNTADPKTFLNVPSGSHTISVEYKLQTVSTFSNLLQEDFGSGVPTTSPGIASAYCFNDQHVTAPYVCGTRSVEDNQYSVASFFWRGDDPSSNNSGAWYHFKDHTTNGTDANGRFLLVNIGSAAGPYGVLYSKPIADVIPNQPVKVDLYLANLLRTTINAANPDFIIELVTPGGVVVASQATGIIPNNELWNLRSVSLDPGNNTNLTFKIRSGSILYNGNDALIDDVQVYQLPKICVTKVDFPFIVPSGQAFSASVTGFKNVSCASANDGEITIAAQNFAAAGFYYSLDGAPFTLRATSPFTITGLSAGSHSVRIQYDLSASPCLFTLPQTITAPAAVTVTASVTVLPTCTTGGTITAVGAGGTPAYQYELRNTTGGAIVRPYQANAQFTNVPTGNYTVFARDANLCVSAVGAPVNVVAPLALAATIAAGSDFCYDTVNQASLVVNVTGGKSPFTYSLNGAAAQNGNTFTNVGVGTHSILVTDSNNCTTTISNIIIAPQLQLTATLAQDLTCLVNASITSTIAGGYGAPYTYTVSRNGGATTVPTFPFTATQAGTYVFTVTDSRGCIATSNTITVSPKTTPTLTFSKTDITCNNANNGIITVTASNGFTTAYTYAIKLSSNPTYTTQATNQFTNLSAGTYNIKVIDSKGCESAVSNVTIINPAVVTGTITATDIQCSASGTVPAVVTVNGSGGTTPYKYSFNGTSNFTTTNTFSTTTAGAVTAYIQDNNGCQIGPLSVTVVALDQITDITITDSGYDCSTTPPGGHVNIAAVKAGVSAPIRYQIISGPPGYDSSINSDGEFKSLAPGNYVFRATDIKTNCYYTKPYTVNGAPDIIAGGNIISPIKCFGGTGTIQFTVNGVKDRGYDYTINTTPIQSANNVSETITTINVTTPQPAGVYTITATDRKTKCIATYTVTLTQPSAALAIPNAIGTNVNCNNDNSQITITATGGTPNYSYAFAKSPSTVPSSVYGNSAVLTVDTNSSADLVWDVYVKDANDCIAKTTVTIISDLVPSVTASVTNQCSATGSNFVITATGTGGTGTLTYGINGLAGSFQSGNTFTVSPGTYTVWVKDANGCTASATPVTVYPQLTSAAAVTKTLDCSVSPDAVITTTITGGRSPYTYTVQKGAGAPSAPSTSSASLTFTYNVSNANADTYTFVITDANNCTSTTTVTVNPITNPTVSETHVNPLCNGNANGSVQLTGAGGSGGYTYSTNATTGFTATSLFTGLAAGIHTFYVKDSKGCTGTVTATLINPTTVGVSAVVTTPFSCSVTNTKVGAVITVTGSGGSGTYTYSFNNGTNYSPSNTLTVNDNGSIQSFDIIVRDGNGCLSSVQHIDLAPLNPPTISSIVGTPIYCSPAASTTSTVTVTRTVGTGVGTLAYSIESGPVTNTTGASSGIFTGLTPGVYTFKVTDANGCFAIASYTVNPVTPIAVSAVKLSDVLCNGGNTGAIQFTVSGNATVGNYTYTLTSGTGTLVQTGNTVNLTSIVAGTYTLQVTDNVTSCTANATIVITQPAVLGVSSSVATNVNCNNDNSQITVTATGGTPNYSYAAVVSGSAAPIVSAYNTSNIVTVDTNSAANLVWDVYVKDANDCIAKTT